jgi:hypothetical protein
VLYIQSVKCLTGIFCYVRLLIEPLLHFPRLVFPPSSPQNLKFVYHRYFLLLFVFMRICSNVCISSSCLLMEDNMPINFAMSIIACCTTGSVTRTQRPVHALCSAVYHMHYLMFQTLEFSDVKLGSRRLKSASLFHGAE